MNDILKDFFGKIKDSINCQLPCKITAVNSDGTVDVLVFRNDNIPDCIFPNVPVRHLESSRAYVFLGVAVGDRGVIRFFDRSVEEYKKGNENETSDDRKHSFSDGLFELGFVPTSEAYSYPTNKTIEIGNKNGSFKLSIGEDGGITITTEKDVSMTCLNASINASVSAVVNSPSIDLGGTGGKAIARHGDQVKSGNTVVGTIVATTTIARSK